MRTVAAPGASGRDVRCARVALIAAALPALALCALSAGCGGGDRGGSALLGLDVYPGDFRARVGDVVSLWAMGTFASGEGRDVTHEVSWSSSNPGAGVVSGQGEFTATGAGEAIVTAAKGSITSAPMTITVEPAPHLPTAVYFPLGVMHQWEYTGTEVSPAGVGTTQAPITATFTVTRQVVIDEAVYWEMAVRGTDPDEAPAFRYRRHDPEEGLVEVYRAFSADGYVVVRLVDAALTAGATWTDPEYPERTFTIESVTEYVETPAGDFQDCVLVVETDPDDPDIEELSWYKAGFGMVKWQRHDRRDHVALHEQRLVRARFGLP